VREQYSFIANVDDLDTYSTGCGELKQSSWSRKTGGCWWLALCCKTLYFSCIL